MNLETALSGKIDRMEPSLLHVAQIVPATEAEGPGRRFALWFQGCPLRCPSCCNPEMLPFQGGQAIPLQEIIDQLREAHQRHALEGITLLGGEPTSHARTAVELAKVAHALDLSVMVFTGYLLEDLRISLDADVRALLAETDILVDGPYDRDQPELSRRWIGSANQRVHFLSPRCDANDARWNERNTLEIRLRDGEVTVNGFPAPRAVGIWKRRG
jgi:anaerobic ribonucleoside-triphosphate reductase activating protein